MNIIEAIDDRNLLGAAIRDPELWKPWRGLMAALYGLPLDGYSAELFRACTGRAELPTAAFAFLWLIIGRRGGKSFAMAMIAVYQACFRDWRKYLSPGERAVVLLVAADREQARILHRYIAGILSTPMLASLVENQTADSIDVRGNVTIEVVTRSYRTVRGRSVCCALLDEVAFWRDDNSANPDIEVFNAIRASMATFGDDGLIIIASSPYARRGLLWDGYRKYFGKDDARNLVWLASTRWMNPSVSPSFIAKEYERDPASAASEYGDDGTPVAFRSDITAFVSPDVVDAVVVPGRYELAPILTVKYVAFVDPSGGSSDSMTLAIAHKEGEIIVLDAVREFKPPFSPETVVIDFVGLLKSYGVTKVVGDRYAGEWPRERFRAHGITYEPAEKPKSDIYRDVLPLFNSGAVEILAVPRIASQICSLERRTARGGRDSIDHAPGAHDDLANAVAGALVLAAARPRRVPTLQIGSFCIYSGRNDSSPLAYAEPPDWHKAGFRYPPQDPRWRLMDPDDPQYQKYQRWQELHAIDTTT